MSARGIFNAARIVAEVAILFGLIIAEFGGLRSLGFVCVLIGLVAAGGALSMGVIVREQEPKS